MNNKPCIYKIRNKINDKFYIGSSKSPEDRKYRHFRLLELNKHTNQRLQNSYNKYGKENFEFIILEYCEESNLLDLEKNYLNKIDENYFNINKVADKPPSAKGRILSEKTKKKISEAQKTK